LLAAVRQAVRLNTPDAQGVSRRKSIESAVKQAKKANRPAAVIKRMESELTPVAVPFGPSRLMHLFDALNNKRDFHVMSSMAGSVVVPRPLSSLEIEAHCRARDIDLTPWEAETIDQMDLVYREESLKLRGN
jgi:hypothetical protein